MNLAVLVPVKGFTEAKQRLATVLSPTDRMRLARWLADGVLDALGEIPVFVACDDDDVRSWARERGAEPIWGPGLGLNGAVDDGVRRLAAAGFDHVTITHADLPFPAGVRSVATPGRVTLVPDARLDGTNVMSFPTATPVSASYGTRSFERHLATAGDHAVEVRRDHLLSLDIDTATDLTNPVTREVLPEWLPTIPANHFTHAP